ncbi:MAG: hypothetical protein IPP12_15695 [Nitrospira sp.]|nr:hypothetical protein [Nitrospira sp.]
MSYLQFTRNIVAVLVLLAFAVPAYAGNRDRIIRQWGENSFDMTRAPSKAHPPTPAPIPTPPKPPALGPIHEAPNIRGIENTLPARNPSPSTYVPLENRPGISNTFNNSAKP